MSGIVQRGGESITTELTVGFKFHLSYFTMVGSQTRLLIATGPHVTVNTIVGLPFIEATQAIINLSDNVANLQAIDAPPFPIEYLCATVHVPSIEDGADHLVHLTTANRTLIKTIDHLQAHFSSADMVSDDNFGDRHVSFSTLPGKCFPTLQTALSNASKLGASGFVGNPMDHYCDLGMGPNNE